MTATSPSATPSATTTTTPLLRIAGVLSLRPVLILAMALGLLAANFSLMYTNALIVIVDVITLITLAAAMKAEGSSLGSLFGRWRWIDLAWGALMLVIVIVGFFVSNYAANLIVYGGAPPFSTDAPVVPLWLGLIALIVAPATIAFAEEALYRGYAQPRLAGRIGTAFSLIIVAIIFGVQHIGFALGSVEDVLAKVLTTFFAGLILGALMLWMKRIMPLALAHWGLDILFLGLPTFYLAIA